MVINCPNVMLGLVGPISISKSTLCLPERILRAVDLPMPLVPTSPSTTPGRGTGSWCSLKLLAEYLQGINAY